MTSKVSNIDFHSQIVELLKNARQRVVQTVNHTMVLTYFEIGRMIVEEQQNGKDRAEYGKQILKELSKTLNTEFGKGFSVDNLENMRRFYLTYGKSETLSRISENDNSESPSRISKTAKSSTPLTESSKGETLSDDFKLSWSHYYELLKIKEPTERAFYENQSIIENWSIRELRRQKKTGLFQRISLSKDKNEILELAKKGYNPEFGARPLKRVIQQEISVPIAQYMLKHTGKKAITISEKNGNIIIS